MCHKPGQAAKPGGDAYLRVAAEMSTSDEPDQAAETGELSLEQRSGSYPGRRKCGRWQASTPSVRDEADSPGCPSGHGIRPSPPEPSPPERTPPDRSRPPSVSETWKIRASDVKQFVYCPRIIYYNYVVPVERKTTFKMEYGKEEHVRLDRLEQRRTLKRYRLDEGERRFRLRLSSERLSLEGMLDMLIISPGGYFPVEFKFTESDPGLNHKYQLAAYTLLVEDVFGVPVRTGFLYLVPGKRIYPVDITPNVRRHLFKIMGGIREIVLKGVMPAKNRIPGRCNDCEFRQYCGDID